MLNSEYQDRLKSFWLGFPDADYREKLWLGWSRSFVPNIEPRVYLKTLMDEYEKNGLNHWEPYG